MARYQLRIYTLDSEDSATMYEKIWKRHLTSLPLFGVHVYGMWRPVEKRDQLAVLTSLPQGDELERLGQSYMTSREFLADFDHIEGGFESFKSKILGVEVMDMDPIPASPMR